MENIIHPKFRWQAEAVGSTTDALDPQQGTRETSIKLRTRTARLPVLAIHIDQVADLEFDFFALLVVLLNSMIKRQTRHPAQGRLCYCS